MKSYPKITLHLVFCLAVLCMLQTDGLQAQLAPEVARYGYADTIFVQWEDRQHG